MCLRNNFYLIIRMSSFPTGRCCAGEKCVAPTHELRHKCAGCNKFVHLVCGRVMIAPVLHFKEDDFVCRMCDPLTPRGCALGEPMPQSAAQPPSSTLEPRPPSSKATSLPPSKASSSLPKTSSVSTFPTGRCCAGDNCVVPTHELRHKCAGCKKFLHLICGRVILEPVMNFKADDFVCKVCYPSSSEVAASKAPASTKPVSKAAESKAPSSKKPVSKAAGSKAPSSKKQDSLPKEERDKIFRQRLQDMKSNTGISGGVVASEHSGTANESNNNKQMEESYDDPLSNLYDDNFDHHADGELLHGLNDIVNDDNGTTKNDDDNEDVGGESDHGANDDDNEDVRSVGESDDGANDDEHNTADEIEEDICTSESTDASTSSSAVKKPARN